MTDRELLELAAKAAGLHITGWTRQGGEEVAVLSTGSYWQPILPNGITDCDGDALRLAVTLCMQVECSRGWQHASAYGYSFHVGEEITGDACAATRRAIVRAAAAIGESMP